MPTRVTHTVGQVRISQDRKCVADVMPLRTNHLKNSRNKHARTWGAKKQGDVRKPVARPLLGYCAGRGAPPWPESASEVGSNMARHARGGPHVIWHTDQAR